MKQKQRKRTGMNVPGTVQFLVGSTVAVFAASCIIDTDAPCGEGLIEAKDGTKLCRCPEGDAITPEGCVTCGDNEVVGAAGCDCDMGYERVTPEAECTEIPPPPMMDADAGLTDDMTLTSGGGSLPSDGLGDACTGPADCAGKGANYCESFMLMQCIVSGCDLANNNCPDTYACCDLSMFGVVEPLCLPGGCGP